MLKIAGDPVEVVQVTRVMKRPLPGRYRLVVVFVGFLVTTFSGEKTVRGCEN